jgi:hypothetical protein
MFPPAGDLLVLLGATFFAIEGALRLAYEIKLLIVLGDESPIGIVAANRRVDLKPGGQASLGVREISMGKKVFNQKFL